MEFFRKYKRTIFLITGIGFVMGIFIGFGSYFFYRGWSIDAVASVNGKNISYQKFQTSYQRALDNYRDKGQEVNDDIIQRMKQEVLSSLIQEEIFCQEADKYGIKVTDVELLMNIRSYPAFQQNGVFDRNAYNRVLAYQAHITPAEFEESERRRITMAKLRLLVSASVKVSEPELQIKYAQTNGGKMDNYIKDREKFIQTVLSEKTNAVFNEWFRQIQRELKIKEYLSEMERRFGQR